MEKVHPQSPEHEFLREKILTNIQQHHLLRDQNILVDFEDDEVILYGDVDFEDKKWLAQDLAAQLLKTEHLRNDIKVVDTRTYW